MRLYCISLRLKCIQIIFLKMLALIVQLLYYIVILLICLYECNILHVIIIINIITRILSHTLYFTGIDLRVWKQAQVDNPNPASFIPVPIVGFSELCWKYKCHNEQVTVHKLALNSISDRLTELARKKTRVESKLEQYIDKMDQLTHRIVKVLVGQMVILNAGMALRPEEETIKNQLEVLYNDINSPLRFQVCKIQIKFMQLKFKLFLRFFFLIHYF